MEEDTLQGTGRVHHGHNIRRIRMDKEMKQDVLSKLVCVVQSAVSKYERMQVINDEMLERFAKALNVPVEDLKTMEEEAPSSVAIENNTFTSSAGSDNEGNDNEGEVDIDVIGTTSDDSRQDNKENNHAVYHPIDKVSELFERLLKEKDERISVLEKRIRELEQGR